MRPKILFLKSRLGFPGGLEKYTLQLANRFLQNQCDVTILTTVDAKAPLPLFEGELISLFPTKSSTIAQIIAFDRAARHHTSQNAYDVVFAMERTTEQTHLRAGNGVHRAFLAARERMERWHKRVLVRCNPRDHLIMAYEKRAFENPKLKTLFVNSNRVKEEILTYYKTPADTIMVVANGVDWHGWHPSELADPISKKTTSKETFELLFVGNGYRRKNLDTLLNALSVIPQEPFHLSVVGYDKNIAHYQGRVRALSLEKRVRFYGLQSDLTPFYARADALVLPTLYDPFANVTLEALAMGLFVITSRQNGASEVISPSTALILEDPLDSTALVAALCTALTHPKTAASVHERRRSIQHLDFSDQLDRIVHKTLSAV